MEAVIDDDSSSCHVLHGGQHHNTVNTTSGMLSRKGSSRVGVGSETTNSPWQIISLLRGKCRTLGQHAAGFGCGDFCHCCRCSRAGAGSVVDHACEGNDIVSSMTIMLLLLLSNGGGEIDASTTGGCGGGHYGWLLDFCFRNPSRKNSTTNRSETRQIEAAAPAGIDHTIIISC